MKFKQRKQQKLIDKKFIQYENKKKILNAY